MILIENFKSNKGENPAEFERMVRKYSELLQINPNWLMMVMYFESRLNAQAVNKQAGDSENALVRTEKRATGLIQFMPSTAVRLGTTNKAIYSMNAIDQLYYVYKYYRPWAGKIQNYFDLYLVTFFPDAVGRPDDYVLQTKKLSASLIAKQNPFFDANKDGKVTVGEIKSRMYKSIPTAIVAEVMAGIEKKSSK